MSVTAPPGVAFGSDKHMLGQGSQMMTTEWTAIRRRLTVRRAANRPPWGGRKAGHGPIVAPRATTVAATLAATVVVGVGVALARAERSRRTARASHKRPRQFALLGGERLAEGLRRMALEQLDYTIELLDGRADVASPAIAVHEARKSLKRLRTMVSLLEVELGAATCAREERILREAGRRVAGARDAEVMAATLDRLLKSGPKKFARRRAVVKLRARLAAERERAEQRVLSDTGARVQVLDELRALRARVAKWRLSDRSGIELLEPGVADLYRKGRRRYWLAAAGKGDTARAMHQWRKRVKDLRYAVEMLDRREPGQGRGSNAAKRAARDGAQRSGKGGAERIRSMAREADELAELLGEDHDLVLLATRIRARNRPDAGGSRAGARTRRKLLKMIARRRKRLRKRALRRGAHLFRRPPKKFVRQLTDAYARASRA